MALRERLDSFASLKPDWDSYGAPEIDVRAICAAKQIVGGWSAVPTNSGGVQLEISGPFGDIEIAIGADGKVEWAGAFDKDNNVIQEK